MHWRWGRKKSIRISVEAADRIINLAQPIFSGKNCLACGGQLHDEASPIWVDHSKTCRGVERSRQIEAELMAAIKK